MDSEQLCAIKAPVGWQNELAKGSYTTLHNFALLLHSMQKKDLDVFVAITGQKGTGKSTLGLLLVRAYLEKYFPDISLQKDLERFVAYDNEEVIKNLRDEKNEGMPLVCDEGVRFLMGEDWMKGESKELKKLFTQIRPRHRIVFVCIPEFFWIDPKYRENMILFWVHVFGRGKAMIFTADLKVGVPDKWHREMFLKKCAPNRAFTIFTPTTELMSIYARHPCFFDVLSFPKIDHFLYDKYLKMRIARTIDAPLLPKEDPKDFWKNRTKKIKEMPAPLIAPPNPLAEPPPIEQI